MSKDYANVNPLTGTFAGWLSKANELYYDMETIIVTASPVAVANITNQSTTTGLVGGAKSLGATANSYLNGTFSSNELVVKTALRGGTVTTQFANSQTLLITSNVHIGSGSSADKLTVFGDTILYEDVTIGNVVGDALLIEANTNINGQVYFHANARFDDNDYLNFGTGDDVKLWHNGTDLRLQHSANTSNFIIEDSAGRDTFYFHTDNSFLQIARYDGHADGPMLILRDIAPTANTQVTGRIAFQAADSGDNNLQYATVLGTVVDNINGTEDGAIFLQTVVAGTQNRSLITINDYGLGEVRLNYANSTASTMRLSTESYGVLVTGELESTTLDVNGVWDITGVGNLHANTHWDDDNRLLIGTGSDLQIYHNASHSYITDNGTGNLKISSSQIDFLGLNLGVETMATMVVDGAVTLYHNNAIKIATTATGVNVTGLTDTDTLFTSAQANAASIMVRDLTNNRITIAGTAGELEDDANFTFDGTTFKVGGADATVFSANTDGTIFTSAQANVASLNIRDLTTNRVLIAGTTGEVEDDANLTFDGTTFEVGGGYGATGVDIAMNGNIKTNGTLTVDGLATLNAGIAVDTNKFTVADTSGNVSTAGTLNVTGESSLDGGLRVDDSFIVSGSTGAISTTSTLTVTGATVLNGGLTMDTNKFTVADTSGNVTAAGTVLISNTTTSSSSTTGALRVGGGAGIVENLNVGGNADISGNLVVDGTATFAGSGNFTVNNSIVTTLSVIGDTDIGNGTADTVTITARVDSDIVPNANNTRDLGSAALKWRHVYANGTHITSLNASQLSSGTIPLARLNYPSSGNYWSGGVPYVGTTGAVEIGKYIDFHSTDATTANYDWRFDASTTTTFYLGSLLGGNDFTFTSAGNFTATGDITGNLFSGSGASLTSLPAASLTGNIASARLTSVPAGNLTGNIASARLNSVPAASLTGTIADARLPASITSDITGNAATVTNGVYLNTAQTISGAKTFSATTDFNGAVTLDGATTSSTSFTVDDGYMKLEDSRVLYLGSDNDARIFHSGTTLYADINTGSFVIRDGTDSYATALQFTPTTGSLAIYNNDAGASGPQLILSHNSTDADNADIAGSIYFQTNNADNVNHTYALIAAAIVDQTADSEDGSLTLSTIAAGTSRVTIRAQSGAAYLYNGSNLKLNTTTTGVTVTGTAVATDFNTTSDINLKENLEIIENPIEKVKALNGYTFNFKDEPNRRVAGVIAQEVEEVLPEVVGQMTTEDGTSVKTVSYGNMVALLLEAVKEQQKQIDELRTLLTK
jgi:hypothetical protein